MEHYEALAKEYARWAGRQAGPFSPRAALSVLALSAQCCAWLQRGGDRPGLHDNIIGELPYCRRVIGTIRRRS